MIFEYLKHRISDTTAIVELHRPPVNAVTVPMYREIRRLFRDPQVVGQDVRCVVLTGSGRHFCAGNDLTEFEAMDGEAAHENMFHVREAFDAVYSCPVPVIGAVNGVALGTGLALAACCDIVIAAQTARFGLPELKVGVAGGARHLGRMLPQGLTRLLFFTAEPMSATQMAAYGGIAKVVADDALIDEAMAVAALVARHSPTALRHTKRVLNDVEFADLRTGYEREQRVTVLMADHPDSKEAVRAFRESRTPQYRAWRG